MKIELETIPVWDGVQENCECFICSLMAEAQKDAINFYLGNSVMNPETRVRVNEHGFCPKHWRMLAAANKPQGVALMGDTYLETTRVKAEAAINGLLSANNPRQAKKAVGAFHAVIASREKGALFAQLWKSGSSATCIRLATCGERILHFVMHSHKGKDFVFITSLSCWK